MKIYKKSDNVSCNELQEESNLSFKNKEIECKMVCMITSSTRSSMPALDCNKAGALPGG